MIPYSATVYIKGQLHPKIVDHDQLEKMFRTHELFHRVGGPAVEIIYGDGLSYYHWYKDGLEHREDGPSFEVSNGRKGFSLEGKGQSFYQWAKKTNQSIEQVSIYLFDPKDQVRKDAQRYLKYLKGDHSEEASDD